MDTILLDVKDGVALITFNRESKMNAFNREMALLMQNMLDSCEKNKNVRAICITGTGKAFSAGQDLAEATEPAMLGKILPELLNPIVKRIRNIRKPVIAAVNGVAAGAGANIALNCDIVIAASSAVFIQAFSKIGLIPDTGGTFILPRLIGFQKASALMMLGEPVNADKAEQMGMIYKSVPDEQFQNEYMSLALRMAEMPTRALSLTKQALNDSTQNDFDQQLVCEEQLQSTAGRTKDYAEGVAAFLEKRKPVYTGE